MQLTLDTRLAITQDIIDTELPGPEGRPEVVVLDASTQTYFSLNETGVSIWKTIGRNLPLSAAVDELTQEFDVSAEQAAAAVLRLARELCEAGLVTGAAPPG